MSPCADISTKGYVEYSTALLLEPVKNALPLCRHNCLYSRRSHDYELFLDDIGNTVVGIVDIVSCAVSTLLYALAAADTLVMVYHGYETSVLKLLYDISLGSWTFSYAGITADALFWFYNDQFTHII